MGNFGVKFFEVFKNWSKLVLPDRKGIWYVKNQTFIIHLCMLFEYNNINNRQINKWTAQLSLFFDWPLIYFHFKKAVAIGIKFQKSIGFRSRGVHKLRTAAPYVTMVLKVKKKMGCHRFHGVLSLYWGITCTLIYNCLHLFLCIFLFYIFLLTSYIHANNHSFIQPIIQVTFLIRL